MPLAGVVELSPDVALIGHDGWGDGRLGDGARSTVMLNDFVQIQELSSVARQERFARLAALGEESQAHLRPLLEQALASHRRVVLATHAPPFREACWHEGKISDDNWLPLFTNHALGSMLLSVMAEHPKRDLHVLCGHTHGAGEARLRPNLRVSTGGAEYGSPAPQPMLEL